MSTAVQIVLIICITLVAITIIDNKKRGWNTKWKALKKWQMKSTTKY